MDTFKPNTDYIERLVKNSILHKEGKGTTSQYRENHRALLNYELKMTSEEIIKNTKLAFDN